VVPLLNKQRAKLCLCKAQSFFHSRRETKIFGDAKYFCPVLEKFNQAWIAARAGLKPMQPMQLHWAQRLWGPAP